MPVLVLLVTLSLAGGAGPALARADCGLIQDEAKRRTCYAERDRRPSECNLIQDNDERRLCRARAERR